MSISPTCDKCHQELTAFGAILLSPPNDQNEVKKRHICTSCYDEMEKDFQSNK